MAGCKQSRRFLECTDVNFPAQVIEEPAKGDALLDLIVTNKEELFEHVNVEGRLGCSDHEMVEFRTL